MNKRGRFLKLCLVLSLALFLPGCYDRIELEGMAFVVSLGIDRGPDDTIDVTARIAVPSKLSGGGGAGGGGGGGGKEESAIGGAKAITVRAKTLGEALTLMNTNVERRISLIHLSNLVIGESIARDGILEHMRTLTRYREVRRTVNIFVTKGNVRETYEMNSPILEKSVTRFTESLTDVGRHTGLTAPKKLHDFLVSLEAPNEDPIAPLSAVNKQNKSDSKKTGGDVEKGMESTEVTFQPGETLRLGGNPLEFIGTAIFRDDKMVTTLDGIDTRMLLSIRGELRRTQMDFSDPQAEDKFVSLELKHARSPSITVDLHSSPIRIMVKQELEGDLMGIQSDMDYTQPANMEKLEQTIRTTLENRQKAVMERIFHEYQADPFGISKRARLNFATNEELAAFNLREKLRDAEVTVKTDLKIRRVGVQLAPITAK